MGQIVKTTSIHFSRIFCALCLSIAMAIPAFSGTPETDWGIQRPEKLLIEGTMTISTPSTGFEQSAGFEAILRGDTLLLTAKGPFGITVARVYANPDSFLVVNYFQQTAMYGNPNAKGIKDVLPLHVGLQDVLAIMSCVPSQSRTLFTTSDSAVNGIQTFRRADTLQSEVVSVNLEHRTLQSVTRSKPSGIPMLNVTYADVRTVSDSLRVPHSIKVVVNGGEHEVSFSYDEVRTDPPTLAESKLKVPRSFSRTEVR